MGYTVWYKGVSEHPITGAQLDAARANAAEWTDRLSDTAEGYEWSIDDDDDCAISGYTKPGLDDDMDEDVELLVQAVSALAAKLPALSFTVSDDYDSELYP